MKIGGLTDWLTFVDGIVAPAEKILRDVGIAEKDWSTLTTGEICSDTDHREHLMSAADNDGIRDALTAVYLRQEIHRVADQVAYLPNKAAACLSALAWKLHQVVAGLPPDELTGNAQIQKPRSQTPSFLQLRAIGAILSGGYGVQTTGEMFALLAEGRLELRVHDIDVWRDELARKLIFLDVVTQEMDVIEESALDEVVTQARECIQS